MKFSAACVVLAVVAAAGPARAHVLVTAISETFIRLIRTQSLIKEAEQKNYEVLTPALADIAHELHLGLNSDMFQIGKGIRDTMVDVNIKVGQITGNATAVVSHIESVASFFNTFSFPQPRRDFDIKRKRLKRLCEVTLNMTTNVLRLIDETKEMLGKGVSGPLKMLQLTVQLTSDDKIERETANIRRQQITINYPPKWFFFFTDYQALAAAQAMKQRDESTVHRIQQLVATILDHVTWLEGICQVVREELDKERTEMSKIYGKISGAAETVVVIVEDNYQQELSDDDYKAGTQSLTYVMNQLRDEVRNITNTRSRRATRSYYREPYGYRPQSKGQNVNTAPAPYQTATEIYSLNVAPLHRPVRPSWLDNTPVDGCLYIYNNRTAGCITEQTFRAVKWQYTMLTDKYMQLEELFRGYDNGLTNVATQVLNAFKNTANRMDAIKFAADIETKKTMWSDNNKKIRDLYENLNSYVESLFSESNAQLKPKRNMDRRLNDDITRFVDEMNMVALDTFSKIVNDILGINSQVADILSRVQVPVPYPQNKNAPHVNM